MRPQKSTGKLAGNPAAPNGRLGGFYFQIAFKLRRSRLTPALPWERENRPPPSDESNALGNSQAHECFERYFPLTPALSLGERGNRPPLSGESNALSRSGVSALNRGAHGGSRNDALPKKDAGCQFPLPAGEGQGEGERDVSNQNGRTNFASLTRPGRRVCVAYHIERKACRWWKRAEESASRTRPWHSLICLPSASTPGAELL